MFRTTFSFPLKFKILFIVKLLNLRYRIVYMLLLFLDWYINKLHNILTLIFIDWNLFMRYFEVRTWSLHKILVASLIGSKSKSQHFFLILILFFHYFVCSFCLKSVFLKKFTFLLILLLILSIILSLRSFRKIVLSLWKVVFVLINTLVH